LYVKKQWKKEWLREQSKQRQTWNQSLTHNDFLFSPDAMKLSLFYDLSERARNLTTGQLRWAD
jgi:hypothetical protein